MYVSSTRGQHEKHKPCIGVREDQLVRRDADHGAEPVGHRQEFEAPSPAGNPNGIGDNGSAVNKRTGELAQGVQEEVVETAQGYRDEELQHHLASCPHWISDDNVECSG